MATSSNQTDGDFGFQVAPMVDVVFVLLLFFMAYACVLQDEKRLKVPLPRGGGVEIPFVVEVGADGAVAVDGSLVAVGGNETLAPLRDWFKKFPTGELAEATAVLRPSDNAQHGRVIAVMSTLGEAGVQKVSFSK